MTLPSKYRGTARWKRGIWPMVLLYIVMFSLVTLAWIYVLADDIGLGAPPWTLEGTAILVVTLIVILILCYVGRVRLRWGTFFRQSP